MVRRLASNALANLVTGASGMLFQIGLTAIATRSFGRDGFTVWALALSMASLVPLFSVNLSIIVMRRLVALPPERSPVVLRAGVELARQLSAMALVTIVLASILLRAYSQPLQAFGAASFVLLVVLLVAAQIWQVALQPGFGWYYASERNWCVARMIIFLRSGALVGIGLLCWQLAGQPLLAALCLALGTALALAVALAPGGRRSNETAPPKYAAASDVQAERASMKPLLKAFAVWSIGTAAIQYGVPAIVSLMAPQHFNAFFLAYTLNLIVLGSVGAAAAALLAPMLRKRLSSQTAQLERWMTWAPVLTGLMLVVLMAAIWYALPYLLPIWSPGIATPADVRHYLFWLALQTIGRSVTLVYSVMLSSAGRPDQLIRPVVVELCLAGIVAIPLGWALGDIAFLAALAGAGLAAAIYAAWTTLSLGICRPEARIRLMLVLFASQAIALGTWTLAGR
jgi:hypothetical protein